VTFGTANNRDIRHITVFGKLFTQHCGAYANLAFHPSEVGKGRPAWVEKAKAGMVHFIRE